VELDKWRILAHRGLWSETNHQNKSEAISAAWNAGFSLEIDIRDSNRTAVVSHDPINTGEAPLLETILGSLNERVDPEHNQVLALDIKADGLLGLLPECRSDSRDHFFFDMSVPEWQKYKSAHPKNLAVRLSEYEREINTYATPFAWLWLDSFRSDWWLDDPEETKRIDLLSRETAIVIVSPELHGRDPDGVWDYFINGAEEGKNLYICTDFPDRLVQRGQRGV
jgi:hypothetical protein